MRNLACDDCEKVKTGGSNLRPAPCSRIVNLGSGLGMVTVMGSLGSLYVNLDAIRFGRR